MADFYSPHEAAKRWGVTRETVRLWCHAGHVAGARKVGKNWKIPAATVERVERDGMELGEKTDA